MKETKQEDTKVVSLGRNDKKAVIGYYSLQVTSRATTEAPDDPANTQRRKNVVTTSL